VGRAIFIRCTRKGKRNELSETKRDSTPPPFLADAVRRVGGHGGGRETEKGRGTKKKQKKKKGEKREEKRSLKLLPNSVGEAEGTSGEGRIRFTHDCPPRKHIEHAFFRFIGQPIFAPFVLEHGQRRSPSRGERKDGREGGREGGWQGEGFGEFRIPRDGSRWRVYKLITLARVLPSSLLGVRATRRGSFPGNLR